MFSGADADNLPVVVVAASHPRMDEGAAVLAKMLALHARGKVFESAMVERAALSPAEFRTAFVQVATAHKCRCGCVARRGQSFKPTRGEAIRNVG